MQFLLKCCKDAVAFFSNDHGNLKQVSVCKECFLVEVTFRETNFAYHVRLLGLHYIFSNAKDDKGYLTVTYRKHKDLMQRWLVCDWCKDKVEVHWSHSCSPWKNEPYHCVDKVVVSSKFFSKKAKMEIKVHHMCGECLSRHKPFFYIKNGLVVYKKFSAKR